MSYSPSLSFLLLLCFGNNLGLTKRLKDPSDYFMSVASEAKPIEPDFEDELIESFDKFEEAKVDPKLAATFIEWANQETPFNPLSTWRPPIGTENFTDNSFGALAPRKCPFGCSLSKSGKCLPNYNYNSPKQRKIICSYTNNKIRIVSSTYFLIILQIFINFF